MKIVDQSYVILRFPSHTECLEEIEYAGRTCYKSEPKGDPAAFVESIMHRGHLSVIEHISVSVHFITDRGVTHELVRHRLASYSQESTRYCNYSKERFGGELSFIKPVGLSMESWMVWVDAMTAAESYYMQALKTGASPQLARSVLPNSLKTEIVMTANLREWLHVFELR